MRSQLRLKGRTKRVPVVPRDRQSTVAQPMVSRVKSQYARPAAHDAPGLQRGLHTVRPTAAQNRAIEASFFSQQLQ